MDVALRDVTSGYDRVGHDDLNGLFLTLINGKLFFSLVINVRYLSNNGYLITAS